MRFEPPAAAARQQGAAATAENTVQLIPDTPQKETLQRETTTATKPKSDTTTQVTQAGPSTSGRRRYNCRPHKPVCYVDYEEPDFDEYICMSGPPSKKARTAESATTLEIEKPQKKTIQEIQTKSAEVADDSPVRSSATDRPEGSQGTAQDRGQVQAAEKCCDDKLKPKTRTDAKIDKSNNCEEKCKNRLNLSGECNKVKKYECTVCNKTFTQGHHLTEHMRTHTGERPYVCGICKKKCSQGSNLKRHLRTHTGEKPHTCLTCDKKFSLGSHLKRHMRTHTGEQPYECVICNKKFSQGGDLKRHKLIHAGEKPYVCGVCGWKFREKGNLTKHMRGGVHTADRPQKRANKK